MSLKIISESKRRTMKRTNSVISSMYHPIGNSKLKTATCMCVGGVILICLGVGLIVTTLSVRYPKAINSHVDETSVLISGPTCLILGVVVTGLSGFDVWRYRNARNQVESELSRVIGSQDKPSAERNGSIPQTQMPNPKIAIVINKNLWPS